MAKNISLELKKEIVGFYKSYPMTIGDVSEKFNLCNPTITKILREFCVKPYSKAMLYSPQFEEDYFETIDDEYKAYFLGLIVTDGCIFIRGSKSLLALTLQDGDSYLLEILLNKLKSNKKVTSDGRGCSGIHIVSNKVVSDLINYGLTERKSLTISFPKNLPLGMYSHFIRGVLDGDGSVGFYSQHGRKSHLKSVRFCKGNKEFLEDLVEFLYLNVGIDRVNLFREKEHLWSIGYRKKDSVKKIIEYLYNDAHVYMERKKKICDLIYSELL